MDDRVIIVEGISKLYRIGGPLSSHQTLRDKIAEKFRRPWRWARGDGASARSHWALRDVSFEVKRGEVMGVIGRNGAGKSTLLKILSRITEPTEGRARIRGRVGALLEVGTGFHPELTGGENIYLNGAILGMRKSEIERRFDEIVAFAEVEKFVDTPVKWYSSGMYLRLAFAVAAHLEPEILIVDEVLAVGDSAFQRKCLGKMGEASRSGRTVLFVSHNMPAVQNLCSSSLLLDAGRLTCSGPTDAVVLTYLRNIQDLPRQSLADFPGRQGRGRVTFTRFYLSDEDGREVSEGISGKPVALVAEYSSREAAQISDARFSFEIADLHGSLLFLCSSELTGPGFSNLPPVGAVRCVIPELPLSGGRYAVSLFLEVAKEVEDYLQRATCIDVVDGDFYGTGKLYPPGWHGKGVLVPHKWHVHA